MYDAETFSDCSWLFELSASPSDWLAPLFVILVDPRAANRNRVRIAEVLILAVDANIGKRVRADLGQTHRQYPRGEPKGSQFEGVITNVLFGRGSPIRRRTADRALSECIDAESKLGAVR